MGTSPGSRPSCVSHSENRSISSLQAQLPGWSPGHISKVRTPALTPFGRFFTISRDMMHGASPNSSTTAPPLPPPTFTLPLWAPPSWASRKRVTWPRPAHPDVGVAKGGPERWPSAQAQALGPQRETAIWPGRRQGALLLADFFFFFNYCVHHLLRGEI